MKSAIPYFLGLVLVVLVVFAWSGPGFLVPRDLVRDPASGPRGERLPVTARGHALEARRQEVLQVLAGQKRLVEELADGKWSLLEAAGRHRDLQKHFPMFMTILRREGRGDSDEERLCWSLVLDFIPAQLEDPCVAGAVSHRLKGELEDELRRHGRVRLPSAGD